MLQDDALNKAIAKLYILGAPKQRTAEDREKSSSAGAGLGVGLRQMFKHQTPKQAAVAKASPVAQYAQYQRFVQGTGAGPGLAQEAQGWSVSGPEGYNPEPGAQYDRYLQGSGAPIGTVQSGIGTDDQTMNPTDFLKLNNQTGRLRFGGQFTPTGLQIAGQQARLNAQDRLHAKGLIHGAIDGQGTEDEVMSAPTGVGGSDIGSF